MSFEVQLWFFFRKVYVVHFEWVQHSTFFFLNVGSSNIRKLKIIKKMKHKSQDYKIASWLNIIFTNKLYLVKLNFIFHINFNFILTLKFQRWVFHVGFSMIYNFGRR